DLSAGDLGQDGVAHPLEARHRIPALEIDLLREVDEILEPKVQRPVDAFVAPEHPHIVEKEDALHVAGQMLPPERIRTSLREKRFTYKSRVTCRTVSARRMYSLRMGERLVDRMARFARALIVGSGATIIDFSVLATSIHLVGLAPTAARVPALIAGA